MPKEYLFISDLHLDASQPEISKNLNAFLTGRAWDADRLYILGDLFEVWLGDDSPVSGYGHIIQSLKNLCARTQVFFMAGNRDFLLGRQFADELGFEILDEPHLLQLGAHCVALMHGDQLCTDDQDYQNFRELVRSKNWQTQFLAKPLTERQQIAHDLRNRSASAMKQKAVAIMDVNVDAVDACFIQNQADIIIHGHTHRPAMHKYPHGKIRYVLGDWCPEVSYLSWDSKNLFRLVDKRIDL